MRDQVDPQGVVDQHGAVASGVPFEPALGGALGSLVVSRQQLTVAGGPAGRDDRARDDQCCEHRQPPGGAGYVGSDLESVQDASRTPGPHALPDPGDDEGEEGQGDDDERAGQGPAAEHHEREEAQAGDEGPEPTDAQSQREQGRAHDEEPRVEPEPAGHGVVRRRAGVEHAARAGTVEELEPHRVEQAHPMGVREQLALERREQGVETHDEGRGRRERGEAEPAGPGIGPCDHEPDDRRSHQEERLLGQHRGREAGPAPCVRPQPTGRRGREHQRRQQPRHREVVEEHHPLLRHRERAETEQRDGARRGNPAEPDPARQDVEQGRAHEERDEHQDSALRDGHRPAAEAACDPEPSG